MKLSKFDYIMIGAFVLILGAGIAGYYFTDDMVIEANDRAQKAKTEKDALSRAAIRPTPANLKQLEANIENLGNGMNELVSKRLAPAGNPLAEAKALDPLVWKSGLDTEVKQLANDARAKGVALPAATNYYFGFTKYLRTTPTQAATEILQKQLLGITELSRLLFSAEPAALVKVSRTMDEDGPEARESSTPNPDAVSGRVGVGAKGFYRAFPFEVSFTGTSTSVRKFLNAVESSKFIFVTRSVTIKNSKLASVDEPSLRKISDTKPGGTATPQPGVDPSAPAPVAKARGPEFIFGSEKVTATVRIDMIEWNNTPKAAPAAGGNRPVRR